MNIHVSSRWVVVQPRQRSAMINQPICGRRINRSPTEKYSVRFFNYLIWWVWVVVWVTVRVGARGRVSKGLEPG